MAQTSVAYCTKHGLWESDFGCSRQRRRSVYHSDGTVLSGKMQRVDVTCRSERIAFWCLRGVDLIEGNG